MQRNPDVVHLVSTDMHEAIHSIRWILVLVQRNSLPNFVNHSRLLHVLPGNVFIIFHIPKGLPHHAVALKA